MGNLLRLLGRTLVVLGVLVVMMAVAGIAYDQSVEATPGAICDGAGLVMVASLVLGAGGLFGGLLGGLLTLAGHARA